MESISDEKRKRMPGCHSMDIVRSDCTPGHKRLVATVGRAPLGLADQARWATTQLQFLSTIVIAMLQC